MAIQTVNSDNLSQFVAERTARGSKISTGEQMVDAAVRIGTAKSPSGVVKTTEETVSTAPDPGSQEPTAKAQTKAENVAESKAGTDPGVQKRIDKAVTAQREAEELFEAEYTEKMEERAKREALEKRLADLEKPKEELKEPNPDDPKYKTVAEYLKDRAAYDAVVMDRKISAAREEERARIAMEQANAALAVKATQARKDLEDFDEVIAGAVRDKLEPPVAIQAALRESDVGLHIAYHLAKTPEDRERIFALPTWKALREIGKLEDKYLKSEAPAAEAKPKPIETTKAPAPVAKLGGSEGVIAVDLSKETEFLKYKEARKEQLRARRRH